MTRKRTFLILGLAGLAAALLALAAAMEVGRPPRGGKATEESEQRKAYLPLVVKQAWTDPRFGIAEYDGKQVERLGFPDDGRFHAQQWGMPQCDEERCDTVFFSRTDHRCLKWDCSKPSVDWPTPLYCLFTYEVAGKRGNCTGEVAQESGLLDPVGLCEFLQGRPDASVIVGNEEFGPNGIADDVTPAEYAAWYREVWGTVKGCQPSVRVGPYGPMHLDAAKPYLLNFWQAYGEPVPMDFQPVHHYAWPNFVLQDEIDSLLDWLAWLDGHVDAPEYWLTEYGLPCWKSYCPNEGPEVMRAMTGFTCWLLSTGHFQSWAWWDSCWLLKNDQLTEAGELYLHMAQHGCATTLEDRTMDHLMIPLSQTTSPISPVKR